MRFVLARNGGNAPLRERAHLSGVAHAVFIEILPEREPAQFRPAQYAIVVIIQRAQRLKAVAPENPERHIAEHLEGRSDLTLAARIKDQPGGLGRDRAPLSR